MATKIIFDPYKKEDMKTIMFYLVKHEYEQKWKIELDQILLPLVNDSSKDKNLKQLLLLVEAKALERCAVKIDRMSGDLRGCFDIMR